MGTEASPQQLAERFWEKVARGAPHECWEWTANRTEDGYGRFFSGRRRQSGTAILVLAHRWAYEEAFGPVDSDLLVLHRCDNPPCVNPGHLFLGTHADNVADCESKGRRNYIRRVKLTAEIVRDVRRRAEAGAMQRSLARELGVSETTISHIVLRRTWQHVT